jgi:hypothetical protein
MTLFVPSVTESAAITALGTFLRTVNPTLPAENVILGQSNRVAPPPEPEYIVLTPLRREGLAQPSTSYNPENPTDGPTVDISAPYTLVIQVDVHGDNSGDAAQVIVTLFRSPWGVDQFAGSNVTPLFCDDPQQLAFLTGEEQQENRWTFNANLQITPVVSTPIQFADSLTVNLAVPADSGAP